MDPDTDGLHATIETHEVVEVLQLVIKLAYMVISLYDSIDELTGIKQKSRITVDDLTKAIIGHNTETTWMDGNELHLRRPFQVMSRIKRLFLNVGGPDNSSDDVPPPSARAPATPAPALAPAVPGSRVTGAVMFERGEIDEDDDEAPVPDAFEDLRELGDVLTTGPTQEELLVKERTEGEEDIGSCSAAEGGRGEELEVAERYNPPRSLPSTRSYQANTFQSRQQDLPDEQDMKVPTLKAAAAAKRIEDPSIATSAGDGASSTLEESQPPPGPSSDRRDEAIQYIQDILAKTPHDHPHRVSRLGNLANLYDARYKRTKHVDDLKHSISYCKEIITATPRDDPYLLPRLESQAEKWTELYQRTGDLDSLQQGILCTRDALTSLPRGHHAEVYWMVELGNKFDMKYRHGAVIEDLQQAIIYLQAGLKLTPEDNPNRGCYLNVMASRLRRRYQWGGDKDDLQQAVSYAIDAMAATPLDHGHREGHVKDLVSILDLRYDETGAPEHLLEAIGHYKQELAVIPRDETTQIHIYQALVKALCARYITTGAASDVDEAIAFTRGAVATIPTDHPVQVSLAHTLADTLAFRYQSTKQVVDLKEAVLFAKEALAAVGAESPNRVTYANTLCRCLHMEYQDTCDLTDLEAAISFSSQALALSPHDQRPAYNLDLLAGTLTARFDKMGDTADLERAITLGEEAVVTAVADGDPERMYYLGIQGARLRSRYKLTGDSQDLEKAISYGVEAVEGDHPDRCNYMGDLIDGLCARYERLGDFKDLQRAIGYAEELWVVLPPGAEQRLGAGLRLASSFHLRYERTGDVADLHHAVKFSFDCVEETPSDNGVRGQCLDGLASNIFARFQHSQNLEDLHQAILHGEEALTTSVGWPARAGYLKNQAFRLRSRYGRSGAIDDLQQAAMLSEEAVASSIPQSHHHSCRLDSLAGSLADRFNRTGATEDIQRAVMFSRESLNATPPHHFQRASRLVMLSEGIRKIHHRQHETGDISDGEIPDLQEAIRCAREAAQLTLLDSPFRHSYLSHLSRVLWCRYEETGDMENLQESIIYEEEALAGIQDTNPYKPTIHYDIAQKLFKRFRVTDSIEDVGQCLSHLRAAWDRSQSPSLDHLRVYVALLFHQASHALRTVRGETLALSLLPSPEESSSILEGAVVLLQRVGLRSLNRDDQQNRLVRLVGLGERAASASIEAGKAPYDAIKLLEHSRGIIMSLAIDCREDLSDLESAYPVVFNKFNVLRAEIDQPVQEWNDNLTSPYTSLSSIVGRQDNQHWNHRREIRERAAIEMEKTILEIRALPGFELFQLPASPQEIMSMATHGPIVLFVSNCCRSDAIIVTNSAISSIPLPKLHYGEISNRLGLIPGLIPGNYFPWI